MKEKDDKISIFSQFVKKLRADNPNVTDKSNENFQIATDKLGLLGGFSMIKAFAENAEKTVLVSPFSVPLPVLKLYMDAIVNLCIIIEDMISEQESRQKEVDESELNKLKSDLESILNVKTYSGEEKSGNKEEKTLKQQEDMFNSLLGKFKGEKN